MSKLIAVEGCTITCKTPGVSVASFQIVTPPLNDFTCDGKKIYAGTLQVIATGITMGSFTCPSANFTIIPTQVAVSGTDMFFEVEGDGGICVCVGTSGNASTTINFRAEITDAGQNASYIAQGGALINVTVPEDFKNTLDALNENIGTLTEELENQKIISANLEAEVANTFKDAGFVSSKLVFTRVDGTTLEVPITIPSVDVDHLVPSATSGSYVGTSAEPYAEGRINNIYTNYIKSQFDEQEITRNYYSIWACEDNGMNWIRIGTLDLFNNYGRNFFEFECYFCRGWNGNGSQSQKMTMYLHNGYISSVEPGEKRWGLKVIFEDYVNYGTDTFPEQSDNFAFKLCIPDSNLAHRKITLFMRYPKRYYTYSNFSYNIKCVSPNTAKTDFLWTNELQNLKTSDPPSMAGGEVTHDGWLQVMNRVNESITLTADRIGIYGAVAN